MKNRQSIIAGAVVLLFVVAGVFFLLNKPDGSSDIADDPIGDAPIIAMISPDTYQEYFGDKAHMLLDVRTPGEFNGGHIPGAMNISVETLAGRLSDVPQGQPIVVYCRSGNRSATASQILADAGYSEIYDLGGIITWQAAGLPVE